MLFHGVAKARLAASYYRFLFFYFPFSRSQIMLGGRYRFFFFFFLWFSDKNYFYKSNYLCKKKITMSDDAFDAGLMTTCGPLLPFFS